LKNREEFKGGFRMSWKDTFPKENIYFETGSGIIYNGNTLDILKQFPDNSIDTVITSPPYWGLRFYSNNVNTIWDGDENCHHDFILEEININLSVSNKTTLEGVTSNNVKLRKMDGKYKSGFCTKCGAWYGQLGLEPSFNLYIQHLIDIFNEIYRILKPSGTCWINIGDTYYNSSHAKRSRDEKFKQKSLCMIPERFAIKMIENGWILRNTIIWHKPNAMPESTKDRFTNDFEYIYFFVKQPKYYFKQQFEPFAQTTYERVQYRFGESKVSRMFQKGHQTFQKKVLNGELPGRNKRTVWSITTQKSKSQHIAPFPTTIPEICIDAGCPEDGIVLDPFLGSGTTGLVAEQMSRKWIGIELNPDYCEIAKQRIEKVSGLRLFMI